MEARKTNYKSLAAFTLAYWGLWSPGNFVTFFLNYYLLNVAGVETYTTSLIFLASNVWDAVTDPCVGYLSDAISTRWGRRLPWFLLGCGAFPLSLVLLFLGVTSNAWYYLCFFCLLKLTLTFWAIPLAALIVDTHVTDDARNTAIVGRTMGLALGAITGAGVGGAVLSIYDYSNEGHRLAAIVLAVVVVVLTVCALPLLPKDPMNFDQSKTVTVKMIRDIFRMKEFLLLTALQTLGSTTISVCASNLQLYVLHSLDLEDHFITGLLVLTVFSVGVSPLIKLIVTRVGKKNTVILTGIWGLGDAVLFAFIPARNLPFFFLLCAWAGVACSLAFFLMYSMLSDVIDYDHSLTGVPKAGVFFALNALTDKIAIGVATAGVNAVMAALGFNPALDQIPEDIGFYYRVVLATVVLVVSLVSLAIIPCYPLDTAFAEGVRDRLAETMALAPNQQGYDASEQSSSHTSQDIALKSDPPKSTGRRLS